MTGSNLDRQQAVTRAINSVADVPGALLPILHAVQDALGFVPPEAVDEVATRLNLSRADVHGVLSFYHDFRITPPKAHVVRLCRAEACQSMGGVALEALLAERLGIADAHGAHGVNEAADTGNVTYEPAYCFGACACAPAAMIDGTLHGRLDVARLNALLDAMEQPV